MHGALIAVKKLAIFCHRWMGVAFCLLFLWWFVSGIFIMYGSYPEVTEADRLQRAPLLDAARVKLSPLQAAQAAGLLTPEASSDSSASPSFSAVRLSSFDGRPAYFFRLGGGTSAGSAIVYADTGEQQDVFPPELNLRTAAAWAGQPAASAKLEIVDKPDQWTLGNGMRAMLPLNKYVFPGGEQIYLSENTGQVVQFTTTASRIYAYLGVIPHWLYFTPLRLNTPLWSRIVIWSSGLATVAAGLGLIVGIWMWSPGKRYRHQGDPTSIPYTGQKRLHTILGLFFGILAMTWTFSGMLSMEPFDLPGGTPGGSAASRRVQQAFAPRPLDLARYGGRHPREVLSQLDGFPAKELAYASFAGEPVFQIRDGAGNLRVVPANNEAAATLSADHVRQIAADAAGADLANARVLTQYDAYYLERTYDRDKPLPVLLVELKDPGHTRLYIDPATARIAGRYSESTAAWVNRWLYHGLHSFDFPLLYNYRPAWDVVVLGLMLSCVWLSWTSIVLAFRVVRRRLGVAQARRVPNENIPRTEQPAL